MGVRLIDLGSLHPSGESSPADGHSEPQFVGAKNPCLASLGRRPFASLKGDSMVTSHRCLLLLG